MCTQHKMNYKSCKSSIDHQEDEPPEGQLSTIVYITNVHWSISADGEIFICNIIRDGKDGTM